MVDSNRDSLSLLECGAVSCNVCAHRFSPKTHYTKVYKHLSSPIHLFMTLYKKTFNIPLETYKSFFNFYTVYSDFINLEDAKPQCKLCNFQYDLRKIAEIKKHIKTTHEAKLANQNMQQRVTVRRDASKKPLVLFPMGIPGTGSQSKIKYEEEEREMEIDKVLRNHSNKYLVKEKDGELTFLTCQVCCRRFTPFILSNLEPNVVDHLKTNAHKKAVKAVSLVQKKENEERSRLAVGLPAKVADGFISPPKTKKQIRAHPRLIPHKTKKEVARRIVFGNIPIRQNNLVIKSLIIAEVDRPVSAAGVYEGINILWKGNLLI